MPDIPIGRVTGSYDCEANKITYRYLFVWHETQLWQSETVVSLVNLYQIRAQG
jgi:hypothetical protein